ncbi:Prolyl tripeptidyl peptidase precursor [Planctomycetes bacterium Poly30]|uniref:Prolyl tripeptidyl peptidase n=1 Tax=Saltatorellus ferox TaxID=2528018 RepID=A0A518EZA4_9BACT|nr:Prolyl tripeptidyl peptidase precursor [Planctomycetes bacterium Poly30]
MLRLFPLFTVLSTVSIAVPVASAHFLAITQEEAPVAPEETVSSKEEASLDVSKPKTSKEEDWQEWERLGGAVFSPDGRWIAYTIARNDGTSELRLRVIAADSTEVLKEGGNPTFSDDGKWLAYSIGKSDDETEKLRKAKKPVENQMGLFDLVRGEKVEIDGVRSFEFSSDGAFLAMRRYAPKGDENGTDLVIRDLATGLDTHFGRVTSDAWSESGPWIALTVDAPEKQGNGLRVYHAASGVLRTLDSAEAEYVGMSWREDSADLAVMRKKSYEDDEDATFTVLAWKDVSKKSTEPAAFYQFNAEGFPEDLRVTELAGLRWSDDGAALYFGLKEWDEKPAELAKEAESSEKAESPEKEGAAKDGEKPAEVETESKAESKEKSKKREALRDSLEDAPGVEVWHARDIRIIPRQKLMEGRDERETLMAVWWIEENRLVQLENTHVEDVEILEGGLRALGRDETPHEEEQRFAATQADIFSVDVKTGDHTRLLERVKFTMTGHPKGRYFLYVRDGHIWSHDLDTSESVNLTGGVDTNFIDQEDSSLTDEKDPYGVCGWTKDGKRVLLYDRYDIWSFPLKGGKPDRLTSGAENQIVARRARVAADRDDDEFVKMDEGFYVSLYGDLTKKSGYGMIQGGSPMKPLIWKDAQVSRLMRAEDAPVFAYRVEDFDDSPDLVVTGPKLADTKEVSATNAFASQFAWGHSELVDYENANGVPLQGALFYPAGYDPSKTYPMVVYIYELRSQSLHQYASPSETNPYSTAVFTQNGYFVFQPDIVYRAQNPGLSAVECVVPAVQKVLESGKVDPKRVGLFGHSWGAYQTAFIVTQTDLFAAGIAGAPLTNMMSMSMSIYWNSGETDAKIFHESQGRMDRPFWRDVQTYIANSPIFSIEKLNTPLLVAFGDNDGAVDWQQGIEMYNAARLAQRPYVMLVYPGENHGLREKPNQVDYHHRVREWFDTYLNGAEAPKWISEGMPWLEQKEALEKKGDKGKEKE